METPKEIQSSKRSVTISLSHPEIEATFGKIYNTVMAESDMGAVLISTSIVDQYLTKLFANIMPESCSKRTRNSLLNYPGPLSTLSAKIDMAYAMRLIDKNVHTSIHILRDIRNKAAHNPDLFKLDDYKDRLMSMYDIYGGFAELVHAMSQIGVFRSYYERLMEEDEKRAPGERFFENMTLGDVYQELQEHPETLETLQGKKSRLELAFAVAFLCAFIVSSWELHQEKYLTDQLIL